MAIYSSKMSTWNVFRPGIVSVLLVTLLIGEARCFRRFRFEFQPGEIVTQPEGSSLRGRTIITNNPNAAILKASAQQPMRVAQGDEPMAQPLKMDFYDYQQLPSDPDDELPALPDHVVNVNEDYAGIYDYKGSQDGRFRRKRTLTTNVEQFLTRSSRIRSQRGPTRNALDVKAALASPAEQAENLVRLLTLMQDADPEFSPNEFLKVLQNTKITEKDLEYLALLTSLADEGNVQIPDDLLVFSEPHRERPGQDEGTIQKFIFQKKEPGSPMKLRLTTKKTPRSSRTTLEEAVEESGATMLRTLPNMEPLQAFRGSSAGMAM